MQVKTQFSFSRVTTFEQCPRRYRYRYVDGVKEGFSSIEAFMGQQVHSALEWLYKQPEQSGQDGTDPAPSSEDLVGVYCRIWDQEYGASTARVKVIKADMDVEHYRRTGADLVASFHSSRFQDDKLETISLEKHFRVEIDGTYLFQGFIDRLARDQQGLIHIIDYKTGRRTPKRFEGKDAEQLEAYAVAIFKLEPVDELQLTLEYLRSGRAVGRRIRRDEALAIERRMKARIETAADATVFPAQTGILCEWCGFNDLCEAYVPRLRGARKVRPRSSR